jgi:hypothetical protein
MPSLIQLIYVSQPSVLIGSHELVQIVDSCRRNNEQTGITGMLAFSGTHFLQLLEGDEADVECTFARIEHDRRHCSIVVLGSTPIGGRSFGTWSMGFAGMSAFNADLVHRCLGMPEIEPAGLTAERVLDFLAALADRTGAPREAAARN